VDTSFYTPGATAQNVRISTAGGTPVVATWTALANVGVPATLTKTSGGSAWNASAYSNEQILDGTGYVEFTATERTTHRMLGLSNGDTNADWSDIDFAFYLLANGTLEVRESGSGAIPVDTYNTQDTFRIQVSNGIVTYYQNGTLLRASPTAATYPLDVDSSFYEVGGTLDGVTLQGNLNAPVTSRTGNTVLAARVYDETGALVQGPASGVVTFYLAGVPVANDTDADGLEDDLERDVVGTDPLVADTDGDGCLDGTEYNTIHSNPLVADTDRDGVGDCVEFNAGTDPLADTSFPDADSDGVSDAADPFPCDQTKSSVAFVPAEGHYGQLMFEDNWPSKGDLDFNDAVIAYNYKLFRNSDGLVTSFVLTMEPLAMGARLKSGIALRLPVSSTALLSASRSVGGGSPISLTAPAGESEVVVVIAQDVREFFNNQAGLINVQSGPMSDAPQIEVRMSFNAPFPLVLGAEPFDLFYFRTNNERHQIHRPNYQGTDRMNAAFFGTADDGSSPGRWFVDSGGLPFVLALPQVSAWTQEFTALTSLYPNLSTFAASAGQQDQDFYSSSVVSSQAYQASIGLSSQSGGSIAPIPIVVYDRSCTTIPLGF